MSQIVPVGIDLGTTYCTASYIDDAGSTQMVPKADGSLLTPSIVYFDDKGVTVGKFAWDAAALVPDRCAEAAKRDMGSTAYRHKILQRDYPPEVIQGCLLRDISEDCERHLGRPFEAVITVPAYFDEPRRKATADAGSMSGLKVLDIVNEPTAAALAFGEKLGYLDAKGSPKGDLRLLVYDLGGGTFDVTVMQLRQGEVRTLATDGDYELGGLNWDDRLAEYIEHAFRKQFPTSQLDKLDHIAFRRAAMKAKHELTFTQQTMCTVSRGGNTLQMNIARSDFQKITADLVERTLFTTRQALAAAELTWKKIDRLLLVGGSSRMPMIRAALMQISGMEPDSTIHPDEAVARGAAVYARYRLGGEGRYLKVPELTITDVNAHSLGIEGVNLKTERIEAVPIIPRNTPLPHTITRTFVTKTENQPSVKVQLLEGESSLVDECSPLATAAIKNLPPGLPKGTKVKVTYTFQANGRLDVSAAIEGIGDDAHIELERVSGVSSEGVDRWKQVICQDGGFTSFEEALDQLYANFVTSEEEKRKLPDEAHAVQLEPPAGKKANLRPAIDQGAPQAAADKLKEHKGGKPGK